MKVTFNGSGKEARKEELLHRHFGQQPSTFPNFRPKLLFALNALLVGAVRPEAIPPPARGLSALSIRVLGKNEGLEGPGISDYPVLKRHRRNIGNRRNTCILLLSFSCSWSSFLLA